MTVIYAAWGFHTCMCGRRDEVAQRQKGNSLWKGGKGWGGKKKQDDRVAAWSEGFLSPPAIPSVNVRPAPLVFLHTTHNALWLCVPPVISYIRGCIYSALSWAAKTEQGVSRMACSSLKGYHEMRGLGEGTDTADDCIFHWGPELWLRSWLEKKHIRVSVKASIKNKHQSTRCFWKHH